MFNFNIDILIQALIIFIAIMIQVLIGTVRLIVMVKGKKTLSIIIGFFESATSITITITVVSNVMKAGVNIFIILFYSSGFALGLLLGMLISRKISRDMLSINIITRVAEVKMEDVLRENGFGVTRFAGSGKDGELEILNVICAKNSLPF
jgi:uncharacterized protein YebE (UPF0316 family)